MGLIPLAESTLAGSDAWAESAGIVGKYASPFTSLAIKAESKKVKETRRLLATQTESEQQAFLRGQAIAADYRAAHDEVNDRIEAMRGMLDGFFTLAAEIEKTAGGTARPEIYVAELRDLRAVGGEVMRVLLQVDVSKADVKRLQGIVTDLKLYEVILGQAADRLTRVDEKIQGEYAAAAAEAMRQEQERQRAAAAAQRLAEERVVADRAARLAAIQELRERERLEFEELVKLRAMIRKEREALEREIAELARMRAAR